MRIINKATSDEQKFLNRIAYKKMLKDVQNKAESDEEFIKIVGEIQSQKNKVMPFVLLAPENQHGDKVRMMYSKMVNSHYPSRKND